MDNRQPVEFDLRSIKKAVIRKFPLITDSLAEIDFIEVKNGTASTDGRAIYYNPTFLSSLTYDEQTFTIAHEALHIAFDHIERMDDDNLNHNIWNYATDAVINQALKHEHLPLFEGYIDMPEAHNESADTVYNWLLEKYNQEQNQGGQGSDQSQNNDNGSQENSVSQGGTHGQNNNSNGQGGTQSIEEWLQKFGELFDDHKEWNNPQNTNQSKMGNSPQVPNIQDKNNSQNSGTNGDNTAQQGTQQEQNGEDNNQSQENKEQKLPENSNQMSGGEKTDINREYNQEYSAKMKPKNQESNGNNQQHSPISTPETKGKNLEKDFSKQNKQKKQVIAKKIMEEIDDQKNKSQSYGTSGGSTSGSFGYVEAGKSIMNWKRILHREFDDYMRNWSYRRATRDNGYSARISSTHEFEKPRTEVVLDTSGSISDTLLRSFIRQLKPLLRDSDLYVGCFDSKFYGFTHIRSNKDIDTYQFVGRGGTNFNVAAHAFTNDDAINKIVFTDGDVGVMPTADCQKIKRLFWISFENRNFNPNCGRVLFADPSEILKCDKERER